MFVSTRFAQRLPTLRGFALRAYSDSRVAGATATSREFSKKEKAHEDQYIRHQEQLALEKLKKQVEEQKAKLAELEQAVDNHGKKQ